MGCDIHPFVEYRRKGSEHWQGMGGEMSPGRNYRVFGALAGVRSDLPALVEPRGIPDDLSFWTADSYWLGITDKGDEIEGMCTPDQAEEWVEYGARYRVHEADGRKWVSTPDAHTETWLTGEEWRAAVASVDQEWTPAYKAIGAMLKSFEDDGCETRVVFWFDN